MSPNAVGRSSGFHCKAIRSHRKNLSLSSPLTLSARLSRVTSGIGATSFQLPDSSQKAELRCLCFRNSGGGGPSRAINSAIWTRSSNIPSGFLPLIRVRELTMSQAYIYENVSICYSSKSENSSTHDHGNTPYIHLVTPV